MLKTVTSQLPGEQLCQPCDSQPKRKPSLDFLTYLQSLPLMLLLGLAGAVAAVLWAAQGWFRTLPCAWRLGSICVTAGTVLLLTLIHTVIAFLFLPELRVSQPLSYHSFADRRCWCCGIPNSSDVLSNLPFLLSAIPAASVLATSGE